MILISNVKKIVVFEFAFQANCVQVQVLHVYLQSQNLKIKLITKR